MLRDSVWVVLDNNRPFPPELNPPEGTGKYRHQSNVGSCGRSTGEPSRRTPPSGPHRQSQLVLRWPRARVRRARNPKSLPWAPLLLRKSMLPLLINQSDRKTRNAIAESTMTVTATRKRVLDRRHVRSGAGMGHRIASEHNRPVRRSRPTHRSTPAHSPRISPQSCAYRPLRCSLERRESRVLVPNRGV